MASFYNTAPAAYYNSSTLITPILPLTNLLHMNLGLTDATISTISANFSGFREIKSTIDSVGFSFIMSFLDSSIHFSNLEKITKLKTLFEKYRNEMELGDIESQFRLIVKIQEIIEDWSLSADKKLEKFQTYLDFYYNEFFYLYRNCMNAISKLLYNIQKDEFEMIRFTLSFDEIKQITNNSACPFPKLILMYYAEFFQSRLCIVNARTFIIEQLGSQLCQPIFVLDIDERYYPLSTNFEASLRTIPNHVQYTELIKFITQSQQLKYSNEILKDLDSKIQEQKKKLAEGQDVFLRLMTNCETEAVTSDLCLDGKINYDHDKLLDMIVCDRCRVVARNYQFECNHRICVTCYSMLGYADPVICPMCSVRCYRVQNV